MSLLALWACELVFAPTKRVGQGEVGGCTQRLQTAWLLLNLALKSHLVGNGDIFSHPLHK